MKRYISPVLFVRPRLYTFSTKVAPNTPVPSPKPPLHTRIWKRVKEEAHHYWVGTKLLGANMRLSFKLLRRVMRGEVLSRREKGLLEQTVGDSIRLVPFLVIAVVPFLEFSLPFLLKLFPNMLPSTYTTKDQAQSNQNASLKVRLEMAKFLKSATLRLMEEEKSKELTNESAQEFLKRASQGKPVSNAEIIKVGRLLKSEFALNNIGVEELHAVARFFQVKTFGPRSYIEFLLDRKISKLREDDALIARDGLEKLSLEELIQANFLRGMKVEGCTREQLEQQLEDWMELADNEDVPPFLLLLSRSFDTSKEAAVASEAIDRLSKTESVKERLENLPDDADLLEKKLADHTQTSEYSDLSRNFYAVDTDRDGSINRSELEDLLRRLDETVTTAKVEEQMERFDLDRDGKLDFKGFLAVMKTLQAEEDQRALSPEAKPKPKKLEDPEKAAPEVPGVKKVTAKINSMLGDIKKEIVKLEGKAPALEEASSKLKSALIDVERELQQVAGTKDAKKKD